MKGNAVAGEDAEGGKHVVRDPLELAALVVLDGDGLDVAVLVPGRVHVQAGLAPHVLVQDKGSLLLDRGHVVVGAEHVFVDLKKKVTEIRKSRPNKAEQENPSRYFLTRIFFFVNCHPVIFTHHAAGHKWVSKTVKSPL